MRGDETFDKFTGLAILIMSIAMFLIAFAMFYREVFR